MTTVYFIRHAQADNSIRDGRNRPLTEKGFADRKLVTEFLQDKNIDVVLSSPFKRAVDTIADFAEKNGFDIELIEDFRERKSDSDWGGSTKGLEILPFIKRQWGDFTYTLSDGESLAEVQNRNIAALEDVLVKYKDNNIVIGTHGMSLSTIINYYDKTYGFDNCAAMLDILPWVVRMDFNDDGCIGMEKIDLFNPITIPDFNQCKVRTANLGALKAYRFVVIFARYHDKWLYCYAKSRDSFETAGGHIEEGEMPIEAAKRELYEETGAIKFDITPVFDYSVHYPNVYANGQVFLAQIYELGDIPDYETTITEVKLFDATPDKMRFPQILPVLFEKVSKMI